ncbi:ABC transporter substrate-binding protein [Alicyclobacillus vulcanalis]|uniref:Carbohydrate ABC transporter substrate-binding protein, CUT1 family n=1 Tax=Alicyclobacillus vulcanalis TaxID=252246 RepID=A0A1N7LMG0_9BACL|nr:sugar ABC transporter substrate-binding protein [Alicyclobacillus vulcanalis]SIS75033.1 carbohydrate ABC transporter substrate-binding protein, CUT1 family [Alicyclobacillus vulcanalis]
MKAISTRGGRKKIASLGGVSLLTLGAIAGVAGCGTSTSNTAQTNSQGAASTGKITINFAVWGPVSPQYNFIAAFEKKYPNIHVNLTEIPQTDYAQKLISEVATNTAPDVMLVWENMIQPFAKEGAIVNLNSYIKGDKSLEPSNFLPAFRSLAAQNGGVYGLPWCYATHLLFYNEDMFKKAGVPFPTANWTWKDYENAAKKLTIVKDGRVVQWGSAGIGFPGVWYSLIGSAGDKIVSNGKLSIGQGAIDAMNWQIDLTNKLKVQPQPSAANSAVDLFEAGKAAMILNGSWMISTYDTIKNFKWNIAPLPYDKVPYDDIHTAFFTINSHSPYKQADWDFIKFCMSPEGQELIEKGTNNPSAELSLSKYAWYQNAGPNGPTNWSAFQEAGKYARLGYVLLPTGLTNYIDNQLNAAVLGQESPSQVVKLAEQQAQQVSNQ